MAENIKQSQEKISNSDENSSNLDENSSTICLPDYDAKIAELAYYKAESRNFEPGYELEDWYAAEQDFLL